MKRWELEAAYARVLREKAELEVQLAHQASEIASLKAMVEELQRQAHRQAGRFRRDPRKLSEAPKRPGRKAGEGSWSRRAEPTEEERREGQTKQSMLSGCPCCGGELEALQEHRHFEVDIPRVQPVWTEFRNQSGYCPTCLKRYRSRHADQISEATGAAGVVIGPVAKAMASDMKHHLGVSYAKIGAFLETMHGLPVSRSGLHRSDMRLAARAEPVYQELIGLIRQSCQAHVDETGWRIGTLSAWLWVFCDREVTVYTIRRSRGHEVVLEILGEEFGGCLTADGLLTYDATALSDWLQQKCLAHILRRLRSLSASRTAAHLALAEGAITLLKQALALAASRDTLEGVAYVEAAAALEERLDSLIATHLSDADDDGARMARHLTKHRGQLLPFLYDPRLEATNNRAERGLRPGVITRKVGGCNRSDQGAKAHAILASIGATCRQRGIPVIEFLVELLRATDNPPSITASTPRAAPAAPG